MKNITGEDIVIGVDIALNKTGIVIMSQKMKIVYTHTLVLKQNLTYLAKLDEILTYFREFFEEVFEQKPASVQLVLEGRLTRGFSGSTLASIEGARVTTYHAFHLTLQKCVPGEKPNVFIYSPGVVKQFFTGKTTANKSEMLKSAYSRFSSLEKIEFQEDVFDAIYLGLFHILEGRKGIDAATKRAKKSPKPKNTGSVARPRKAPSKPRRRPRKT